MAIAKRITNIQIKNLFGDFNIEWDIPEEHRIIVLVGKNGTGKTTILNAIRSLFSDKNILKKDTYDSINIKVCEKNKFYSKSVTMQSLHDLDKQLTQNQIEAIDLMNKSKAYSLPAENMKKIEDLLDESKKLKLFLDSILEGGYSDLISKYRHVNFSGDVSLKISNISTIDLLANATREFKDSSGDSVNYLNEEITRSLKGIQESKYIDELSNLETILNSFFSDTSKKIVITSRNQIEIFSKSGKALQLSDLSSGERQLLFIFLKVFLADIDKCDLVLMDEPEISLHLAWQKKLLSELEKINKYSQMIIVTHSPAMVMKGWRDAYIDINSILCTEV